MRLTDILDITNIVMHTNVSSKEEALKYVVEIAGRNNTLPASDICERLLVKEQSRTTGFGKNVALPHIIYSKMDNLAAGLMILETPLEWGSVDNKPVSIIGVVAGSSSMLRQFTQILFSFSKLLADDNCRQLILKQRNVQSIYDIIKTEEQRLANGKLV